MNNMYFWLQRCSICLDQTYNLCLESCRDQFCQECFSRYVEETIDQSWGLGVSRIKCPVCAEDIAQREWSRYVSGLTVAKYNRYNQPYRPYTRHCPCGHTVAPCPSPQSEQISRESRLAEIANALDRFSTAAQNPYPVEKVLSHFLTICQTDSTFRIGRVQEIYQYVIPVLCDTVQQQPTLYSLAATISKQLVALEIIPEVWKQTQFKHIAYFPSETCTHCGHTLCLQCGEQAHPQLTCLQQLTHTLAYSTDRELNATLEWKLNHTRPCPNCSVMIHRDEGCNKVDCLQCGYRFCWRCGSSWTQQKCKFYQCGENNPECLLNEKAELGVPDMQAIDAKRQT
ncbi:hypothetical protein BY458DRAFT_183914 [Sporodiniella umbellata]|nr:hypothetical protein BY458DRAFT_183914 [Sporodiniella umbellata]